MFTSTVFHHAVYGHPSRCAILHGPVGETLWFGFVHLPDGGTCPTEAFPELATQCRREFYPHLDPASIRWFDIWPGYQSLTNKFQLWHMPLPWNGQLQRYTRCEATPIGTLPAGPAMEFLRAAQALSDSFEP